MNLANLGLAGINAAQYRLSIAGHNINNADTEGFNRQSVLVSTARAVDLGSGYVGGGVQVDSVRRAYDGFLAGQLVAARSAGASLAAYGNEIVQINNLLADRTVGIVPALQRFFDGVQAVASAPADSAARQELLGRASSLGGQINDANAFFEAQRGNINTQVATLVEQVNSHLVRIHDLNRQIMTARASGSDQPPNDLLDQRDQTVADLNLLVKVKVVEQAGSFDIMIGNGQVLLGGATVFPLRAVPAADDPARIVVAYSPASGSPQAAGTVELGDRAVTGGALQGLMLYRSTLDEVQNDLGRMAVGLAQSVNRIHQSGFDLAGQPGAVFFVVGEPRTVAGAGNTGGAELKASFTLPDGADSLAGLDYKILFDGSNYIVTSLPGGREVYRGASLNNVEISGVSLSLDAGGGAARPGDSWLLQPTRNAAAGLGLAITDPSRFAAADGGGGTANGAMALELAGLQTKKVLGGGTMNLNDAFARIVNKVGVATQQNSASAKAQQTLIQHGFAAQQSVSGVNLNEERVNLDRYQEQFRAAARLIEVGSSLFDAVLGIRA